MKKKVTVLDTLFRDGKQAAEMNISQAKALEIVKWMAHLGFDYAELGFAVGNEFSKNLIKEALKLDLGNLKIAVFGRTRKAGISVEDWEDVRAICELRPQTAVIVCKSRYIDTINTLLVTPEENTTMVYDTIKYLKGEGFEVIADLEHAVDAYYGRQAKGKKMDKDSAYQSRKYFMSIVEAAIAAGADIVVPCDTTGGGSPEEIAGMVRDLVKRHRNHPIGFHGHNDCGLAVANTRAAVLAGAMHVQAVTNGYGERCGNTNTLTAICRLQLKDRINLVPKESIRQFTTYANVVAQSFNRSVLRRQPFVGSWACATSAGMHASGETRDDGSYLCFEPSDVGNEKRIKINSQSGRANILAAAEEYDLPLDSDQVKHFMHNYSNEINCGGFEINDESLILALMRARGDVYPYFNIATRVITETDDFISTNFKVVIGGIEEKRGVNSTGPVQGQFNALKKALRRHYPNVDKLNLISYDSVALGVTEKGEGAPVRVHAGFSVENGDGPIMFSTIGVHESQNKAGLNALIDAMHWFFVQRKIKNKNLK